MEHCDWHHVAILSAKALKIFNRKGEDQFGSGL